MVYAVILEKVGSKYCPRIIFRICAVLCRDMKRNIGDVPGFAIAAEKQHYPVISVLYVDLVFIGVSRLFGVGACIGGRYGYG